MKQSFNQVFESIRSAIPARTEAVVLYRVRHFDDSAEVLFAFHDNARTATAYFDAFENLAKQGLAGAKAAVIFTRWPDMPRAWAVADAFDMEQ